MSQVGTVRVLHKRADDQTEILYTRAEYLRGATALVEDTYNNPELLLKQSMLDSLDDILGEFNV
jgi:hypothetical protein